MRLREYRFEPAPVQPDTLVAPWTAERPGQYPAIKIETDIGSFALVATISRTDRYGMTGRRDVQIHRDAGEALRTGEAAERTINRSDMSWSGGAIIPLGQDLQRKLSAYHHDVPPPLSAHHLDYSYDGVYGGVIQRAHLYGTTQAAYEMADIQSRYKDAYEPILAIYPDRPNLANRQAGEMPIAITYLIAEDSPDRLPALEAGTIVVPSLLKTTYLTEL